MESKEVKPLLSMRLKEKLKVIISGIRICEYAGCGEDDGWPA